MTDRFVFTKTSPENEGQKKRGKDTTAPKVFPSALWEGLKRRSLT